MKILIMKRTNLKTITNSKTMTIRLLVMTIRSNPQVGKDYVISKKKTILIKTMMMS